MKTRRRNLFWVALLVSMSLSLLSLIWLVAVIPAFVAFIIATVELFGTHEDGDS